MSNRDGETQATIAIAQQLGEKPEEKEIELVKTTLEKLQKRTAASIKKDMRLDLDNLKLVDRERITKELVTWLHEPISDEDLTKVLKALLKWASTKGQDSQIRKEAIVAILTSTQNGSMMKDVDRQHAVRLFLRHAQAAGEPTHELWKRHLEIVNEKLKDQTLTKWITKWSRVANTLEEKRNWESFLTNNVEPGKLLTNTTRQTCEIQLKTQHTGKALAESIVVWNGNGIRARWNKERNELKEVVHATKPDILCFLEAKTDENLLALHGFEDWAQDNGFTSIHATGR